MNADQRVNTITDHGCFGCGEQNVQGLQLKFFRVPDGIRAEFTTQPQHEGYTRLTHGGIVATLLDEAMSWAVIDSGRLAVTAKMDIQFRRPVPVGAWVEVLGRVECDRGRLVDARAEIRDRDGTVLASSTGVFARVSLSQQQEWEARYLIGGAISSAE